jgi:hypothetical protein
MLECACAAKSDAPRPQKEPPRTGATSNLRYKEPEPLPIKALAGIIPGSLRRKIDARGLHGGYQFTLSALFSLPHRSARVSPTFSSSASCPVRAPRPSFTDRHGIPSVLPWLQSTSTWSALRDLTVPGQGSMQEKVPDQCAARSDKWSRGIIVGGPLSAFASHAGPEESRMIAVHVCCIRQVKRCCRNEAQE